MIDKAAEKSSFSKADTATSLRDCAYSSMPESGDLHGSTSLGNPKPVVIIGVQHLAG